MKKLTPSKLIFEFITHKSNQDYYDELIDLIVKKIDQNLLDYSKNNIRIVDIEFIPEINNVAITVQSKNKLLSVVFNSKAKEKARESGLNGFISSDVEMMF